MRQQVGLDLTGLDAEAAQLDLLIDAAVEGQRPVWIPARQITRSVEPGGGIGGGGIGDEPSLR